MPDPFSYGRPYILIWWILVFWKSPIQSLETRVWDSLWNVWHTNWALWSPLGFTTCGGLPCWVSQCIYVWNPGSAFRAFCWLNHLVLSLLGLTRPKSDETEKSSISLQSSSFHVRTTTSKNISGLDADKNWGDDQCLPVEDMDLQKLSLRELEDWLLVAKCRCICPQIQVRTPCFSFQELGWFRQLKRGDRCNRSTWFMREDQCGLKEIPSRPSVFGWHICPAVFRTPNPLLQLRQRVQPGTITTEKHKVKNRVNKKWLDF